MRRRVPGATAVTFVNKKSSGGPDKKHESNGLPAVSGNFNESFAVANEIIFFTIIFPIHTFPLLEIPCIMYTIK